MAKHLLLISESNSYLVTSLKNKLESLRFDVHMVNADMGEITAIREELSAILICASEALFEKDSQQAINYIKDKSIEEDIPLFCEGDTEELKQIHSMIPSHVITKEYLRPINVTELAADMNDFIKNAGKHLKKKILVVDDSGAMLRNVKGWLEDKYQVALANSGAMAIKYMALNRPDLVLLDYEMPIVDGRQVLQMIRTETEFSDVPVIFLTSKGDKESVMQVMSLKPEGYLLKTMEPAQIVKAVDEFFVKQRGEKLNK